MNSYIGKSIGEVIELLDKEGISYKVVQNFSDKQKQFDTEIVIRVTKEDDLVILTTGNFLINI